MQADNVTLGSQRRQRGDPFRESRIQRVIKDARATLVNPTRPETPQDRGFYNKLSASRQTTPVTLQPVDRTLWGGKAPLGTQPPPATGTPGISAAQAKAANREEYFSTAATPEVLNLEEDDHHDPKFSALRSLMSLVETEHSVNTLREALAKVNEVHDSILASTPQEELRGNRLLRRLSHYLQKVLADADDSLVLIRASRVLIKYAGSCYTKGEGGDEDRESVMLCLHCLYALSKVAGNDGLFSEEGILEPILLCLEQGSGFVDCIDVLTLACGVLKNTSNCGEIQLKLGTSGAIRVLTTLCKVHIQRIAVEAQQATEVRARVDLLIQATGTLRNLSLSSAHNHQFTKLGTINVLYPSCFRELKAYRDVVLNASRILAKLSHTDDCKAVLSRDSTPTPDLHNHVADIRSMIDTLSVYRTVTPIAVRILFTLGNLVQSAETVRTQIGIQSGLIPLLAEIFCEYCETDEALCGEMEHSWPPEVLEGEGGVAPLSMIDASPGCSPRSASGVQDDKGGAVRLRESGDLLTKMVRFFANLAISPEVGPAIAAEGSVVLNLIKLLQTKKVDTSEELLLNTVCCITNMSYYIPEEGEAPNLVTKHQWEIGEAVATLLMHDHVDAVIEVGRVFGNFSRCAEMRAWMVQTRVDEACAILIDHSDRRVVLAVCGVLLNFSSDPKHVSLFANYELLQRIQEVLEIVEHTDFELLSLLFKLCYNLADKGYLTEAAASIRNRAIELLSIAQSLPSSQQDQVLDFEEVAGNSIDLFSRIIACEEGEEG